MRKAYADKLSDLLDVSPSGADLLPEQNLEILKSSFINAAELTLVHGRKKQPDWFLESISTLQPLIDAKKNIALGHWLRVRSVTHKKLFRQKQRQVKRAIDAAKDNWIQKIAKVAEFTKNGQT